MQTHDELLLDTCSKFKRKDSIHVRSLNERKHTGQKNEDSVIKHVSSSRNVIENNRQLRKAKG